MKKKGKWLEKVKAGKGWWTRLVVTACSMLVILVPQLAISSPSFLADEIGGKLFVKSSVCGECHVKIYESWKRSMHAHATVDPVFQTALLQALNITSKDVVKKCLSCHSPAALHGAGEIKDLDLKSEDFRDGVNCDFCHSTSAVDLKRTPGLISRPGLTKYGPFPGLRSPVHKVKYNPIFKSSEFCAGCHEYKPAGVPIITTYSEWKASEYARKKVTCQNCHMPYVEGEIVSPDVKTPSRKKINLHAPPGGHSVSQLKKAVKVEIISKTCENDRYTVEVQVTNVGAGHMVPTGMPSRYLLLKLNVYTLDGKKIFSDEYRFQKVMADARGNPLRRDYEILLKSKKVLSDNRLAPGEKRAISFSFYAPSRKELKVVVSVDYVYEPYVIKKETMKVRVGYEEAIINRH